MRPEDRLDAQLAALRQSGQGVSSVQRPPATKSQQGDEDLWPLLETAQRLGSLREQEPDHAFASRVRAQMLARAAERRAQGTTLEPEQRPQATKLVATKGNPRRSGFNSRHVGVWAGLAAALLVVFIGAGTLEAAAQAEPASPLFPLRRLEQSYQVAAAGGTATRADLHMQYARQWMQAMLASAHQGRSATQFDAALSAMREEDRAAASDIAQMPQGAAQVSEQGKLDSLRQDERTDLTSALAQPIAWESRLQATSALAALGGQTPTIISATEAGSGDAWVITLSGVGFEPGAALVMDGREVGRITTLTPTQVVALAPRVGAGVRGHKWGILNPDGTAALASTLSQAARQPSAPGTPGDHGGPAHGGGQHGGSDGKGQSATPTASTQSSSAPTVGGIGGR